MLSDIELEEIREELRHAQSVQSACIDVMKIVQNHQGYVSDQALQDLAAELNMTTAELDHVATFYNLIFRKPVGKHVIMVCDSISCFVMGGESVMQYLSTKLGIAVGETTADGNFTLLPTVCLGHCEQSPVMMLDQKIYGNLTPEKIDQLLDKLKVEQAE